MTESAEPPPIEMVRAMLADVYTAEGVELWLQSPNPWLDGQRPSTLIEQGNVTPVFDAIEAMRDGAFY